MRAPTLLVTGFGPWPGVPVNPTEALAAALAVLDPAELGAGHVVTKALPTEYERSWAMIRRAVRRHDPAVILHFGLASEADTLRLERFGRRACGPRADAAGYVPQSGKVSQGGPEQIATTLPLKRLATALGHAGLPVVLSDDAGGYLCNATLYRSLHRFGARRSVGFVHVPGRGTLANSDKIRAAAIITIQTTLRLLAARTTRIP